MHPLAFLYAGLIVPVSVVIPLGIAIARYGYINKPLKIIFLYLILSGITNCIASILASERINNLPVLHVYTICEFIFLGLFFYNIIDNRITRQFIVLSLIIFPLFCIINFFLIQNIYSFNSYTRPLEAILLIIFGILHFHLKTLSDTNSRWSNQPETWIVIGIVIYFSSSLAQFSFSNIVSAQASFSTKLLIWNIHASLLLIMYLSFATGFIKCRK